MLGWKDVLTGDMGVDFVLLRVLINEEITFFFFLLKYKR